MQAAVVTGILAPLLLLVLPAGHLTYRGGFLVIGLNSSANASPPGHDGRRLRSGPRAKRFRTHGPLLLTAPAIEQIRLRIRNLYRISFLTVFGFDPELGLDNSEEALDRLRYLVVALPILAYAVIIGLLRRYPISRDSQRQMREIIEEREELAASR